MAAYKKYELTVGAPWFAYKPDNTSHFIKFNKKVPFIFLCLQCESTPCGGVPFAQLSFNGLSAQDFLLTYEDSYFTVPYENYDFHPLKLP